MNRRKEVALTYLKDADDPRLSPYLHVRERDLVGRDGRFLAEGESVLRVLLTASHHPVESLLLAEGRETKLSDLLTNVPEDVPVYVVPQAVMNGVVGFEIHRGILAVGRRAIDGPFGSVAAALEGAVRTVVVLQGITNHDNVGGIFRNAAAFGVDRILLDGESCDPLYRKALRVSVGGTLAVPFVRGGSTEELLEALEKQGFTTYALSPRGAGSVLTEPFAEKRAFLFGSEGPGLPAHLLARLRSLQIPMATGVLGTTFDSLNVAASSAITLFLGCQRSA